MELENIISNSLEEARAELEQFLSDPETVASMTEMTLVLTDALEDGCKILACGNGGSLCDATHFAEELTGRFRGNRRSLPAMAVNDPAYMTCVGNDFAFDEIFARWVEAFGKEGDVLLAISTSGKSGNILKAIEAARTAGMKVVALTADTDNPMRQAADAALLAPAAPHSDRIQEIHIKVIHILIEGVERALGL
jgi:D-sedoheptulose 7-phosphate isomerase